MDGVYRYQRHIYDLTRKYYLLGRDRLLAGLDVPPDGTVLELGCGTGRNIVLAARRYPAARFFGLDISAAMLETAAASLAREAHRRPDHAGARRRDRFRRARPVRPPALRPRLHFLCAVDDPRLGEDDRACAAIAGAGRLAACRRFRPPGTAAALVPRRAARLARQVPRIAARRSPRRTGTPGESGRHEPRIRAALPRLCRACGGAQAAR